MAEFEDTTEPLANGALLPDHPATTTGRKIISYGKVWDDGDGRPLKSGILHENEIRMLMLGHNMTLSHLYAFVIRDKRILHTRNLVTIDVTVTEDETSTD